MLGIPVVTAGTGRYAARGFTIDPTSRDEYAKFCSKDCRILRDLDAEQIRRARLHYYGALNLRPVPMRSFVFDYDADKNRGHAPKYDVLLTANADPQLQQSEDLGRVVHWLTELNSPELLANDLPC